MYMGFHERWASLLRDLFYELLFIFVIIQGIPLKVGNLSWACRGGKNNPISSYKIFFYNASLPRYLSLKL